MMDAPVNVVFTATILTMDEDGTRCATEAEYTSIFTSMADYLFTREDLLEPDVWGKAATGELEVKFALRVGTDAKRQAAEIIDGMNRSAGVLTPFDYSDSPSQHVGVIASSPSFSMALA